MMTAKYLTRAEAADYVSAQGLPCAKGTLGKMATTGGGPIYRVFGKRAVYTPEDLQTWIAAKISPPKCSTSMGLPS